MKSRRRKRKEVPAGPWPDARFLRPAGKSEERPLRPLSAGRIRRAREVSDRIRMACGSSGLAFVKKEGPLWRVRYWIDGYDFQAKFRSLRLAGFVARLVEAGANPVGFLHRGGVNAGCEGPSLETKFLLNGASAFSIFRDARNEDERIFRPNHFLVDESSATLFRGHSWFGCPDRRGAPKSVAVRPVVMVDRKKREVRLLWVSVDDGLPWLPRPSTEIGLAHPGKGAVVADLRPGAKNHYPRPRRLSDLHKRPGFRMFTQEVDDWLGDDAIAPFSEEDGKILLPRTGKVMVERTSLLALCCTVPNRVGPGVEPVYEMPPPPPEWEGDWDDWDDWEDPE